MLDSFWCAGSSAQTYEAGGEAPELSIIPTYVELSNRTSSGRLSAGSTPHTQPSSLPSFCPASFRSPPPTLRTFRDVNPAQRRRHHRSLTAAGRSDLPGRCRTPLHCVGDPGVFKNPSSRIISPSFSVVAMKAPPKDDCVGHRLFDILNQLLGDVFIG